MYMRLLLGISLLVVLNGCAAMFNQDYHRAEVIGPMGITATGPDGNQLIILHDSVRQYLYLPTFDTFVTFHYGTTSKRVSLHRSYSSNTLLDYLLIVPNLYVDDALGTWREYDPINLIIDSTRGADTALQSKTPNFWENEHRPSLLFGAGFGFTIDLTPRGGLAPELGEYEVGIGIRHVVELYYRRSGEGFIGEVDTSFYSLPSVNIQSPVLRYYPSSNYFLEAGPSFVKIGLDSAWWNHAPNYFWPSSSNFIFKYVTGLTAGVGWSGDLSYFDIRGDWAFKPYQFFNLPAHQFIELVMTFGIMFKV
jgi:hypothetical protein